MAWPETKLSNTFTFSALFSLTYHAGNGAIL